MEIRSDLQFVGFTLRSFAKLRKSESSRTFVGGGDFDEGSKIAEFHTEILGFVSGRVGSICNNNSVDRGSSNGLR